jgi:hypothetical protein
MPRRKFSTSTTLYDEVVPWLAARGELAYSIRQPPEQDYYFQYSWIIPGIFGTNENRRRHFWFGKPDRNCPDVRLLFAFWNNARRGERHELFLSNGKFRTNDVAAPIAACHHRSDWPFRTDRVIFIQHGSYLIANSNSQPEIENGKVVLYRGIQNNEVFNFYRLRNPDIRSKLLTVHKETLTDSVISFNAVHCNVARSETCFLNDRSPLLCEVASKAGLQPGDEAIQSMLYSGYAMEEWCGMRKFGPNYVKFRTSAANIRVTSFVCNETEVKVIDPNKLEVVDAVGCKVREIEV